MPAISVIIPIYNGGKYLSDCLNSLLAQDFSDFEILCFDDGSIDHTEQIVRQYVMSFPQKVKYYYHENCGAYRTRREAICKADGQYLLFADADDMVDPQYLSKLYQKAEEEHADITVCGFDRINRQSGAVLSVEMTKWGNSSMEITPTQSRLLAVNTSLWNKLYRRDVLDNLPAFETPPVFMEDLLINFTAFLHADKMAFLPGVLYHYMIHPESIVQNVNEGNIKEIETVVLEYKNVLSHHGRGLDYSEMFDAIVFIHYGLSLMHRCSLACPHYRDWNRYVKAGILFLDRYFSRWRSTRLLDSNFKMAVSRFFARHGLLGVFLQLYKTVILLSGKEIKW